MLFSLPRPSSVEQGINNKTDSDRGMDLALPASPPPTSSSPSTVTARPEGIYRWPAAPVCQQRFVQTSIISQHRWETCIQFLPPFFLPGAKAAAARRSRIGRMSNEEPLVKQTSNTVTEMQTRSISQIASVDCALQCLAARVQRQQLSPFAGPLMLKTS